LSICFCLSSCYSANYTLRKTFTGLNKFNPAFSGDGSKLAFLSENNGQRKLWLEEVSTSRNLAIRHLLRYKPYASPSLSWSGRYIAIICEFQGRKIVLIEDRIAGKFYKIPTPIHLKMETISLSPDGSKLVISHKKNNRIYLKFIDLSKTLASDYIPSRYSFR